MRDIVKEKRLMRKEKRQKMNIDQQLQVLIDNAPADGVTPKVIQKAIAPILTRLASRLQHQEYYILQNLDSAWVMTTLSNRANPIQQKKVIYAFATLKDAKTFQGTSDTAMIAKPIPVTHILFQMFALNQVDSTIFMDTPGNLTIGTEIYRADLQTLVQTQLKELGFTPHSKPSNIPSNLA